MDGRFGLVKVPHTSHQFLTRLPCILRRSVSLGGMATALLSGSKHGTSRLSASLRAHEADIVVADSRDGLVTLTNRLPQRSISAYVQFLMKGDATSSWVPPLTERLETLTLVAPLLAPEAAVVLVANESSDPARDEGVAAGLRLLTEAALSTWDKVGVRVSVAQEASPDEITGLLRHQGAPKGWAVPLADLGADRDYADWRTDILSLTSVADVTFFGWVNQQGDPKVGILRDSVLSPLAVSTEDPYTWGTAEPGALALGRALIATTLGGKAVDNGLIELFVKDVISSLDTTGFELSAAEVDRWIRRHLEQPRS